MRSREVQGNGDGGENVKVESILEPKMHAVLPKLVVFDLDYTLWPFYCEFRAKHEIPYLYPDAKGILCALKDKGIPLAIASRTPTPNIADAFLKKLQLKSFFVSQQIFPSWTHKTDHFKAIQLETKVPFCSMLFFDDEERNIHQVSKMGVTSIRVEHGMTLTALEEGLSQFAKNDAKAKNKSQQ